MHDHTNLPIEIKPKLVRDKIPEIIEKNEDIKPITRVLDDKEYGERLIEKIHEETEELFLAIKEKTNPVEELADVLELVNAVADYVGSSFEEVEKERLVKLEKRGGFKKRIMLLGKEDKK
ncbi:MAG: nucleoside triphosphate pyrophosphohydrolase [bacterium]|nr:nucleoside triphosphate pyrophosphohydrolase [bacterium]